MSPGVVSTALCPHRCLFVPSRPKSDNHQSPPSDKHSIQSGKSASKTNKNSHISRCVSPSHTRGFTCDDAALSFWKHETCAAWGEWETDDSLMIFYSKLPLSLSYALVLTLHVSPEGSSNFGVTVPAASSSAFAIPRYRCHNNKIMTLGQYLPKIPRYWYWKYPTAKTWNNLK